METTQMLDFKSQIEQGIPQELPLLKQYDSSVSHAPKRKDILSPDEKKLALRNALRYFDKKHHPILVKEFSCKNKLLKQTLVVHHSIFKILRKHVCKPKVKNQNEVIL